MKIVFVGAGSTVFVKNLVGDLFVTEGVPADLEIALYDIDPVRSEESRLVAEALTTNFNQGRASVKTFVGVENRSAALEGAAIVIFTVQVGGYKPATVSDFEIPKKYGIRQTIGDTLGIGGIFRGLRTIPVIDAMIEEMHHVAPNAILLNYTNPMAIVTGAALDRWPGRTVGLCHSVQVCAPHLLRDLGMEAHDLRWSIAGINHMAWLLEIRDGKRDLYPEIKRRAAEKNRAALSGDADRHPDMVRYEIMKHFGYYTTESSEHAAEYTPYWIKNSAPERIERFNIPLDEYPRRCEEQISAWEEQRVALADTGQIAHDRSVEYSADIVAAYATDLPSRIHGNVRNDGSIPNLPQDAVVEVPVMVDGNGLHRVPVEPLPPQCAALNRTNINVQLLTISAARELRRERVYQAAMLDPVTSSELPPEEIISMCDELFEAHRAYLPEYR